MDYKQYTYLVRQLELQALENPHRFRGQVLLVSGVAYLAMALFIGLLAVFVSTLFGFLESNGNPLLMLELGLLGLAIVLLAFVVLRAFLAPVQAPDGREVCADEAPRLFALIERVRDKLDGPNLYKVLIDTSFNARIAQIPRFGLFGGHRNYLVVGLPYLYGVSSREMLATLAHEYAHLVGSDGKLSVWVYRQRRTFMAMMEHVSQRDSLPDRLVHKMLERFYPYFNAYTFVQSRQSEFLADAVASRLAGRDANASGLCRETLLSYWFARKFWPSIYDQSSEHAQPTFMPYTALATAFTAAHADWATPRRLGAALKQRSDLLDTHPCLRERLDAIECAAIMPAPLEKSAAQNLLGSFATTLAREFDEAWWASERKTWQAHFQEQVQSRSVIEHYGNRQLDALNVFDLQEFSSALARVGQNSEARHVLEHLLARSDGPFPRARLLHAKLMLEAGENAGLEELSKAAREDLKLRDECARRGYEFLRRSRNEEEAESWARGLLSPAT